MCLGIPGQVVEVTRFEELGLAEGKVRFGAVVRDVNLAFTPEVQVGDYVVVHVGFSISVVDEAQAQETLAYLRELGELEAELGTEDSA